MGNIFADNKAKCKRGEFWFPWDKTLKCAYLDRPCNFFCVAFQRTMKCPKCDATLSSDEFDFEKTMCNKCVEAFHD